MKKISLLLPTYNRYEQVKRLIDYLQRESVLSLDCVEVIISNNGSIDNTYEYLNGLNDERIKVYNQAENLGLVKNMKFLISKATGEYIWIMGDNDFYEPNSLRYVLGILDNNPDLGHVFINYGYIDSESGTRLNGVCNIEGGYYSNGFEMFVKIIENVDLGSQMFVSSNIYRRDLVIEAEKIIFDSNELDNMAFPLGYSLYCSSKASFFVSNTLVFNETNSPSTWSDQSVLVYCRDMIAIYDCIAKRFSNYKQLIKILIKNPMTRYSEFKYMTKQNRFKKNNYALRFYIAHSPFTVLRDLLSFPVFIVKYVFRKYKW